MKNKTRQNQIIAVILYFFFVHTVHPISIVLQHSSTREEVTKKAQYQSLISFCSLLKESTNYSEDEKLSKLSPTEADHLLHFYQEYKDVQNLPMIAGAALIAPGWIIGSAHNLNGSVGLAFVCNLGENTFFSRIESIHPYPHLDIALGKLAYPIMSEDCKPVKLVGTDSVLKPDDTFYAVSDYLHRLSSGISDTDILERVPMPCSLSAEITPSIQSITFSAINNSTIQRGTHGGDSGSGIVRKLSKPDTEECEMELVAIYPSPEGGKLGSVYLGNTAVRKWIGTLTGL